MVGRSVGCLLVLFATALPVFVAAQAPRYQRPTPEFLVQPASPELSGRAIVRLPRRPVLPPGECVFPRFVRAAGMIFSGTVTKIERQPANAGQTLETIAVTFHIEHAIRGTTSGRELTITQWIGLWSSGQRYRVGERVLVFLYPPSKLGLTSSVGGPLGRFNIDVAGQVLLSPQHITAFRKDPVLGGRSRARFSDFALAVRHAREEE